MRAAASRFAVAIALLAPAAAPQAADWKPDQAVEIVIGTSPGSGSDVTGRSIQRWMREKKLIEVPANVVNKPGGGGTIALTYLNQRPGSGQYLMVSSPSLLTNHITGRTPLKYSDTTPLAQLGAESVVFTVRTESPLRTAKDLAARLKADPASLSFSIGIAIGSHNHIATAEVAKAMGADIRKLKVVAFSGSADGLAALLGGHIDVAASPASGVLAHVRAGTLRVLAVSSEQRLAGELAAVPTWMELGIPAVSANWRSVVGPRGLSEQQVRYWDEVFGRLARLPEWKQELEAKSVEATYLDSRDTRKRMDAEHAALTAVLTELGLVK
ncbi:MAG: tripartite tricarboxylate transporter substrate binding protein [Burkholderiales bacterium]